MITLRGAPLSTPFLSWWERKWRGSWSGDATLSRLGGGSGVHAQGEQVSRDLRRIRCWWEENR